MLIDTARRFLHARHTRVKNQRTIDTLKSHLQSDVPLLLVHQMGRAGSMTTVNSIRAGGVPLPVYHTHWLNPESVRTRIGWTRQPNESRRPLNVRVSTLISEELARATPTQRQWTVVTVFREPVARNVSVFFLAIEVFVKNFFERHARGEIDNAYLKDVFLKEFPHDEPITWFDREMRDVFGIDVYANEFPQAQGYQILRAPQVDLLAIKLEQLNDCYRQAFSEFIGLELPGLENTHITDKDPAFSMYADFVRNTALPDRYLDDMYSSRFARHFYSDEELRGFRRKWSEKGL